MKFNQFDMEQQIMNCWNVCEDLDTLMEGVLERSMTTDQISNVLIGMKELYQLKFEKLWEQYEAMCAQKAQMKQATLFDHLESFKQGGSNWDDNMNSVGDTSTVTWQDHDPDYEFNAKGEVL